VLAGILTAGGLLLIVYAEQRAREEDKRDHQRIARVAHQLTNPLHKFQQELEGLLNSSAKIPAAERLQIKHMSTNSKVLLENIRDVFLALQAQEGTVVKELRVYDLCALVDESITRAQPLAQARNVELTYKTHCDKAPVRLDRQLFFIALAHLIENAIFYTQTPGLVNIAVTKGQRHARIIVQDRGVGITKQAAPKVLKPFARGKQAEQFDPDGIGLGLALTKLILRDFGGTLSWRSKPNGLGTEFSIQLPLVETP